MTHPESINIPAGLCQCGCGSPTRLAPENDASKGWIRGRPLLYLKGHRTRTRNIPADSPYTVEDRGYKTPCWIWRLGINGSGYGKLKVAGKNLLAHRVYYQRKYGVVPPGLEADHLCCQRSCVNPDHIEMVTGIENSYRRPWNKLTRERAREIRRLAATGEYSQHQMAVMFGVAQPTISAVINRRTWKR